MFSLLCGLWQWLLEKEDGDACAHDSVENSGESDARRSAAWFCLVSTTLARPPL